jgi:murein DD-endopeptidase MepM/ murein hydrolase activator NlpD
VKSGASKLTSAGVPLCALLLLLYARFDVAATHVPTAMVVTPIVTQPVTFALRPPPHEAPKAASKAASKAVASKPAKKRRTVKGPVSNIDADGNVQLIIPVLGISASKLRDTFDDARGTGRVHDAIDIMAAHGTPVLAAAASTVIKRDHGARGGNALYALGDDGRTVYYYAHLDGYADGVIKGRKLNAGDVIGYVGDTGNAGPGNYHLHFEIMTTTDPHRYWGGAPTNPFPLLRKGITIKQ